MPPATTLPAGYHLLSTVDLSKSRKALAASIVTGIVLLLTAGWLLLQLAESFRPGGLQTTPFDDILTTTPDGSTSVVLPFPVILGGVVAFVLVMLTHELVHGLFYWRFSGQRPTLGFKGPYVYVAAPPHYYFPRNQYLMVGVAPFVLLSLLATVLAAIAPPIALPSVIFFVAFNAAGSAGDLLMSAYLFSYSSDTLMQDRDTSVMVYGPE